MKTTMIMTMITTIKINVYKKTMMMEMTITTIKLKVSTKRMTMMVMTNTEIGKKKLPEPLSYLRFAN